MGCKSLLLPSSLNAANVSSSPLSKPQSHPLLLLPPTSSPSYPPLPPYSLRISRRSMVACYAAAASSSSPSPSPSSASSPARELRKLLESPGAHQGPACFDALSAKLVERAGFRFCFTSGDGDNGYGNQMNVKRTVKGFIKAGFAGIILEDQVSPKACGHTNGRKVVSREEAIMRIKAAIDARKESGSDIVIVARTDSRQAISLEESLWRSRAFADAGADVLFIDALASREEMRAFCEITPLLPKMANMLEGGGKTPILNPVELEEIGFKIICYPLSLIGVSIRAMEDALTAIKGGRVPPPGSLPSFEEIKDTLGFNEYYEEEKRYMVTPAQPSNRRGYIPASRSYEPRTARKDFESRAYRPQEPVVEILPPSLYDGFSSSDPRDQMGGMWSRKLKLKITGRNGLEKLDVSIPAGFLEGMSRIIPGLAGVNIMELLTNAPEDEVSGSQSGKVLLDFNDAMGDRIQVFVE
ncbi:2,3-dimethylmalate lyase [Ananas comosus]|uniref:2,3-dimethylmalate lyase n=1 Tax=Ananas comosus TaxID=4615 RepID=A0A199VTI1_ANACO|nr:2,3-dimethylmalate lyase [Ananas comosus]